MNTRLPNFICTLLVAVCCASTAWADTKLKDSTATGVGPTYQKALASALFNAVNQSKGLTVSSEKQLRADIEHVFNDNVHTIKGRIGVEEQIFTLSKGWIDSYTVTAQREPAATDGSWSVTVQAKIPHHETSLANDQRQRVAVMPFRFAHTTFAIDAGGTRSNGYALSQRIRDRVLSTLTQSQQLAVLNRQFDGDFASEKALLSSDNVPPREAARIGNMAGADYMITGNIHRLQSESETKEFYGMRKTRVTDIVDLSYQLVEVASQKVEWADTIKAEIERSEDDSVDDTLDQIATMISAGVLDMLFPVRVLDIVDETQIYLNQGQARLKQGAELALFSAGRTLKDPDTGIEIKVDGKQVATIVVEQAAAKYSIASLQDGSIKGVKKGDVVRHVHQPETAPYADKQVRETPGSSEAPVQW